MRNLVEAEMIQVSGGWGHAGAAVGAASGAAGYLGQASTSGQFSWGALASATVTGAGLGAIGGPVGARTAYLAPRIAAAGGAIGGRQQ